MVQFLSPAWVRALDDAAATADLGGAGFDHASLDGLIVAYDVEGFGYHLAFDRGGLHVLEGLPADATVTFRADRATIAAIARGELSAQRAFMAGRLRIGGDAAALIRAQGAVAVLPDLFAAVRPETEW